MKVSKPISRLISGILVINILLNSILPTLVYAQYEEYYSDYTTPYNTPPYYTPDTNDIVQPQPEPVPVSDDYVPPPYYSPYDTPYTPSEGSGEIGRVEAPSATAPTLNDDWSHAYDDMSANTNTGSFWPAEYNPEPSSAPAPVASAPDPSSQPAYYPSLPVYSPDPSGDPAPAYVPQYTPAPIPASSSSPSYLQERLKAAEDDPYANYRFVETTPPPEPAYLVAAAPENAGGFFSNVWGAVSAFPGNAVTAVSDWGSGLVTSDPTEEAFPSQGELDARIQTDVTAATNNTGNVALGQGAAEELGEYAYTLPKNPYDANGNWVGLNLAYCDGTPCPTTTKPDYGALQPIDDLSSADGQKRLGALWGIADLVSQGALNLSNRAKELWEKNTHLNELRNESTGVVLLGYQNSEFRNQTFNMSDEEFREYAKGEIIRQRNAIDTRGGFSVVEDPNTVDPELIEKALKERDRQKLESEIPGELQELEADVNVTIAMNAYGGAAGGVVLKGAGRLGRPLIKAVVSKLDDVIETAVPEGALAQEAAAVRTALDDGMPVWGGADDVAVDCVTANVLGASTSFYQQYIKGEVLAAAVAPACRVRSSTLGKSEIGSGNSGGARNDDAVIGANDKGSVAIGDGVSFNFNGGAGYTASEPAVNYAARVLDEIPINSDPNKVLQQLKDLRDRGAPNAIAAARGEGSTTFSAAQYVENGGRRNVVMAAAGDIDHAMITVDGKVTFVKSGVHIRNRDTSAPSAVIDSEGSRRSLDQLDRPRGPEEYAIREEIITVRDNDAYFVTVSDALVDNHVLDDPVLMKKLVEQANGDPQKLVNLMVEEGKKRALEAEANFAAGRGAGVTTSRGVVQGKGVDDTSVVVMDLRSPGVNPSSAIIPPAADIPATAATWRNNALISPNAVLQGGSWVTPALQVVQLVGVGTFAAGGALLVVPQLLRPTTPVQPSTPFAATDNQFTPYDNRPAISKPAAPAARPAPIVVTGKGVNVTTNPTTGFPQAGIDDSYVPQRGAPITVQAFTPVLASTSPGKTLYPIPDEGIPPAQSTKPLDPINDTENSDVNRGGSPAQPQPLTPIYDAEDNAGKSGLPPAQPNPLTPINDTEESNLNRGGSPAQPTVPGYNTPPDYTGEIGRVVDPEVKPLSDDIVPVVPADRLINPSHHKDCDSKLGYNVNIELWNIGGKEHYKSGSPTSEWCLPDDIDRKSIPVRINQALYPVCDANTGAEVWMEQWVSISSGKYERVGAKTGRTCGNDNIPPSQKNMQSSINFAPNLAKRPNNLSIVEDKSVSLIKFITNLLFGKDALAQDNTQVAEEEENIDAFSINRPMTQNDYAVTLAANQAKQDVLNGGKINSNDIAENILSNLIIQPVGIQTDDGLKVTTGSDGSVSFEAIGGTYQITNISSVKGADITAPSKVTVEKGVNMVYLAINEGTGQVKKIDSTDLVEHLHKSADFTVVKVAAFYDKNSNNKLDEGENLVPWAGVSVTLTKDAPTQRISLSAGWNLITLPAQPSTGLTAASLINEVAKQGGYVTTVSTYESGVWKSYVKRGSTDYSGDDFAIEPGKGYFVKAITSVDFTFPGQDFDAPIKHQLSSGWNAVGISKSDKAYKASDIINELNTKNSGADAISRWQYSLWETYVQNQQKYGRDFVMINGKGYLIRVKNQGEVEL